MYIRNGIRTALSDYKDAHDKKVLSILSEDGGMSICNEEFGLKEPVDIRSDFTFMPTRNDLDLLRKYIEERFFPEYYTPADGVWDEKDINEVFSSEYKKAKNSISKKINPLQELVNAAMDYCHFENEWDKENPPVDRFLNYALPETTENLNEWDIQKHSGPCQTDGAIDAYNKEDGVTFADPKANESVTGIDENGAFIGLERLRDGKPKSNASPLAN
jgi:hypothetical protein